MTLALPLNLPSDAVAEAANWPCPWIPNPAFGSAQARSRSVHFLKRPRGREGEVSAS